jgi:predicted nucleotidyltransferase
MLSEHEVEKIRAVLSNKPNVRYAVLFGSALGRLLPHSDIDLLVGGDLTSAEMTDLSMDLALALRRQVDIVLSEKGRCEVVLNALCSGVPVIVRDKARIREDYFRNFRLCDDAAPLRKIRRERLKRVYGNG